MRLLAQKVFRTGLQQLWTDDWGRYWMRLQNRSNDTLVEVPATRAHLWLARLC